ncbi:U3 small nuclear riboprotein factor 55K [Lycorma delicatula]|uniref:U3 small nuclear riboprotein factor 55K n=1 Tax=Lycorma delicatula TaxID=130591 RepID=UPI003F51711A
MSSFFIRDKKGGSKRKLDHNKGLYQKNAKNRRLSSLRKNKGNPEPTVNYDDEEILSSEEELFENDSRKNFSEDEEPVTAQEKKVQLTKTYLEEIKRAEQDRLENAEVSNDVLANRLKEEALEQIGKLKKKVADKLLTVTSDDVHILRNKDHKLSITCLVISSDSKFIYSASKDCFIVKWIMNYKRKIKSISSAHKQKDTSKVGHNDVIISLAISNDNRFLASGDVKNVIHIWNPRSLDHIHCFKGHSGPVTGLTICRKSNNLYSSSGDRSIKVWSLEEMMYVETLFGHQCTVSSIDILCKDRAVSSGGADNSVRVWKIPEESQLIFNGSGRTIDMVRRLDDNHFVSCGEDGLICVWGIFKKKPLHVINNAHDLDFFTKEPNWVTSVASLAMSDVFASGSCNGCVKLWKNEDNFRNVSLLFTVPVKGYVNAMAFSSDENYLVLGVGQEHKLGRWETIKEAKNSVVVIELKKKNGLSSNEHSGF